MSVTIFEKHDNARNLTEWLYANPDGSFTHVDTARDDRALARGDKASDRQLSTDEALVAHSEHAAAIRRAASYFKPRA